jgi:APA family basic amino acid/polyamine antiporter
MVGSGIFRTPGLVAGRLGRPSLTFLVWVLGGALSLSGALLFAELATRHPTAGGKWFFAREAFGRRAAFVVGWIETGIYAGALAGIGVVCGEYLVRLVGFTADPRGVGASVLAVVTGLNLLGVATGRWAQNLATSAKVLALLAVTALAAAAGSGAGWSSAPGGVPEGAALLGALAVAFQSVIWTYYGYADAAKIAEEVVDPERTLPRVLLLGIGSAALLYLLLNAALLHVLPMRTIAGSTLPAGDLAEALFGARGGALLTALALLVVLGSVNGNVFVTPRVAFGLARDGLAPRALARVNAGGTPWTAMLFVACVSIALAATGTFEHLLSLTILLVLLIDGFMVLVLFRLRRRAPEAPFRVPLYPALPLAFLGVYAALFAGAALEQPRLVASTAGLVAATALLSGLAVREPAA